MPKKHRPDPFAAREAREYDEPITSREAITGWLESQKPQTLREIAAHFELTSPTQLEALRRRLGAMKRDGQIQADQKGVYTIVPEDELQNGVIDVGRDGRTYVWIGDERVLVTPRHRYRVFPGDKVRVKLQTLEYRHGLEASIVDIVEANTTTMMGRLYRDDEGAFVVPVDQRLDQDISIPENYCGKAKDGQLVSVEIIDYPTRKSLAIGKVIAVLGDHLTAPMVIDSAIDEHQIPKLWPNKVLKEADHFPESVPKKDCEGRLDLRHLPFVTIDGEDAKDFDDAVYCEPKDKGGWTLYVAIADVSHYVTPNSALDRESQDRGNSVYFPDRVVPMLPESLSNGLCSLKPKVDRLVLVCEMHINAKGLRERYQFHVGVIHSQARLTYTTVAAYLEGKKDKPTVGNAVEGKVAHNIDALYQLFKALLQQRNARGALEFDSIETKVVLDDKGHVTTVEPYQRNDAHRIIEECMLLANVSAADFFKKTKTESLYRVHEGLKTDRLEELRTFLSVRGLALKGGDQPTHQDLNEVIVKASTREDYPLIQTMLLRSMTQAYYTHDNIGHFGLAYEAYAHFTSPIRRYADLIVHRTLRHLLNKNDSKGIHYARANLLSIGEHISMTERRADDASRDVIATLKCLYIEEHLGKTFPGVISGVLNFGFFVTLTDLYVDGMVHVSNLPGDYYQLEPKSQKLIGQRTGRSFKLGQHVNVKVAAVDVMGGKIDLQLV